MQTGIWNSLAHSLWLCGFGQIKIQAPGLSFSETRWLWRHVCQQDTALCSRSGTADWMSSGATWKFDHGRSARVTWCPTISTVFYSVFNMNLTLYQNVVIRLPSEQQYFVYDDHHLKCCHPVVLYYTRLILCSE